MCSGILNPCAPGSNFGDGINFFFFFFFLMYLFFCLFLSLLLQCKFANSTLLSLLSFSYFITPYDAQACSAFSALIITLFVPPKSLLSLCCLFLIKLLEKVQKRAVRFLTGNYTYETGRMTSILEQLKWGSLKKRGSRLTMLYKSLKGAASISPNDLALQKIT